MWWVHGDGQRRTWTSMRVRVTGRGQKWARCGGYALLAALATAACGNTGRNGATWTTSQTTGGSRATGASGNGGEGGGVVNSVFEAVPGGMHRLNSPEYRATVSDVLGTALQPVLLGREGEIYGFDNNAEVLGVNDVDYSRYLEAAEQIAADVFASDALRARIVTCTGADDAACVRSVISGLGRRLFRRPVLDPELAAYEKVYAAARARAETHDGALEQVLVALLASAQFLYRIEFASGLPGVQPVAAYDLASRLSYFLWSSAPDDALLAAAETETLATDDQLSAQLERMWDDSKSARFVESFAGQWLGARRIPNHPVATAVFPEWTPEVANAAALEVYQYFDEFLRQDLDFSAFFQGRAHFVNAELAKFYGLQVSGEGTQRITVANGERTGYVGLVGFLALTSMDRRTSVPIRGNTILRNLLCTSLPPPPNNVPKLEDGEEKHRTVREYFEHVSEDEICGSCHKVIDPFGFALDQYDAIGRFRTTYEDGQPIDVRVQAPQSEWFPQGLQLNGLGSVADALTQDPRIKTCAAEKLYTYGMGRLLNDVDRRNIAALARDWQTGELTIKQLARRLVLATPFRFQTERTEP